MTSAKLQLFELEVDGQRYKLALALGAAELVKIGPDVNETIARDKPTKVLAKWFHLCAQAKDGFSCRALAEAPRPAPAAAEAPPLLEPPAGATYTCQIYGEPSKTYKARATLKGHGYFFPNVTRGLWRKHGVSAAQLPAEQRLADSLGLTFTSEPEQPPEQPAA